MNRECDTNANSFYTLYIANTKNIETGGNEKNKTKINKSIENKNEFTTLKYRSYRPINVGIDLIKSL